MDLLIKVFAGLIGIGVDVIVSWVVWRFLIKPRVVRFIDRRIVAYLSGAE